MKAELIRPDGTREPFDMKKSATPREQLRHLYATFGHGCHTVQMIHLRNGGRMWMDEDGKYHTPEQRNEVATKMLHEAGGVPSDYIVGCVVVETPERRKK